MRDVLIPAIFSLSALLWGITSPIWAKRSDRVGRKPMIALGLAAFAVSMSLCAVVVFMGLQRWLPVWAVFLLLLLSRAIFGAVGSAANPASQAFVAERTRRSERTQAMASLAGAFGLGTVVGPFVAPLFELPAMGVARLSGPMFAFALFAFAVLVVVVRGLEETPPPADPDAGRPSGRSAGPDLSRSAGPGVGPGRPDAAARSSFALWRDPRLAPFLIYGFLVASCQTAQGYTLGFLIIDKLHLAPIKAQGFTAVAMGAGAVSGLLAQWGLIRMFGMGAKDLLRWGVGLAAAANLLVAFAPSYWAVVAGYAMASLGYGFARPGFTAGASLSVSGPEQASAAGAIASINGASVIVAPVLAVWMYEQAPPSPFLLNGLILAGLLAYAVLNRTLKSVEDAPASEAATTAAELERAEDAGPGF